MSDLDPYQTPVSSLGEGVSQGLPAFNAEGWPLASRWQRLGSFLIDALIMVSIATTVMVPVVWFDLDLTSDGLVDVLGSVVVCVSYLLINGHWMAKYGQTVGKKALGIYMVGYETNTVLPLGHIIVRRYLPFWLLELVPGFEFVVSPINGLFIFGREKRCLHDLLAGTKVVAKPPFAHDPPAAPQ